MKTPNNNSNNSHSNSQFSSKHSAKGNMTSRRQSARLAFLVALMVVTLVSTVIPAAAEIVKPQVTVAQLAGSWQATIVGEGGCGFGTKLVTFTLNSSGLATDATWSYHNTGCGDNEFTGQTFEILTLNSAGTGTAQLGIGGGVVLTFSIQVAPNHQVFNMVDITDSGNYEEGTAIVK